MRFQRKKLQKLRKRGHLLAISLSVIDRRDDYDGLLTISVEKDGSMLERYQVGNEKCSPLVLDKLEPGDRHALLRRRVSVDPFESPPAKFLKGHRWLTSKRHVAMECRFMLPAVVEHGRVLCAEMRLNVWGGANGGLCSLRLGDAKSLLYLNRFEHRHFAGMVKLPMAAFPNSLVTKIVALLAIAVVVAWFGHAAVTAAAAAGATTPAGIALLAALAFFLLLVALYLEIGNQMGGANGQVLVTRATALRTRINSLQRHVVNGNLVTGDDIEELKEMQKELEELSELAEEISGGDLGSDDVEALNEAMDSLYEDAQQAYEDQ